MCMQKIWLQQRQQQPVCVYVWVCTNVLGKAVRATAKIKHRNEIVVNHQNDDNSTFVCTYICTCVQHSIVALPNIHTPACTDRTTGKQKKMTNLSTSCRYQEIECFLSSFVPLWCWLYKMIFGHRLQTTIHEQSYCRSRGQGIQWQINRCYHQQN